MQTVFKMVGDWNKTMKTTMDMALNASITVYGRTAEQAVKHAVIRMAIAAKARTPKSRERRKVLSDKNGKYVEAWRQGYRNPFKLHKWKFYSTKNHRGDEGFNATGWEKAQIIKNRGLAKRSWMWGLSKWGAPTDQRKEISGTSEVFFRKADRVVTAVKRNKLGYIDVIMPGGWAKEAEQAAANIIMKQAQMKMERDFSKAIKSGGIVAQSNVSQYFIGEAA